MNKDLNFYQLSFNIYIEMLLRLLALFVNTYLISKYEITLLAAMSSANQIFIIATTVFSFLAVGSSVLISQALGAKNKNLAIRAAHISLFFNFLIGIFCFLISFVFAKGLLLALNIPLDILNDSLIYLKTISFVILLDSIFIALSSVIRTYAKSTELMYISIIMNVINISFNALFLFKYELGLFGVGLSSIISRVIALILLTLVYFKIAKLKLYPSLFLKIRLDILLKILKIGGFSAGENLLWSLQYMVVFSFVALLGSKYLSIQTIYFQISMFIFTFSSAISVANEIIIGRLVGKLDFTSAYKHAYKALKLAIGFNLFGVFIVFVFQDYILDALSLNSEMKSIIRPLFYISIALESSRALNIVMVNSLRASGDAAFAFFMGIIFMWGVSVPLAYVLAIKCELGMIGIWGAFLADEFLRGLCNTFRWKSKKWQEKILV